MNVQGKLYKVVGCKTILLPTHLFDPQGDCKARLPRACGRWTTSQAGNPCHQPVPQGSSCCCSPGWKPGASGIPASPRPRGLGSFSACFCLLRHGIWAGVLAAFWPLVGPLSQSCESAIPAMSGPIRVPSAEAFEGIICL